MLEILREQLALQESEKAMTEDAIGEYIRGRAREFLELTQI